jgi:zinc D-Ala-D-Ala carboxypeptidase
MKKSYDHFSKVDMTDWRWPSFSPREIACKGTGRLVVDSEALDKLQALRDRLGKPLILTSAYRSPEHNKRVGGAKNSMHMQGIAFDVMMTNHDPYVFESAARAVGFKGFGFYQKSGFIHVDTGSERSWGKRWPMVASATDWPVETARQPETIAEDKQAQAVVGAGVAGGLAAAVEHAPLAGSILGSLAPTAQLIAVVVAAALLGYVLWKRSR